MGLIVVVLAAVAGWWIWLFRQVRASAHWDSTDGQIVRSEVTTSWRERGNSENATRHSADIQYQYRVGENDYVGTRIAFGGNGRTSFAMVAKMLVQKYPLGFTVPVFYDPRRPGHAVLERRISGTVYVAFCIALFFSIAYAARMASWAD